MADMKFLLSQTGLCQDHYNEAKRMGITDLKDFGRLQLVLLWTVIANTAQTAFWEIFHILHDPEAKRAVQKEVENFVIEKKKNYASNSWINCLLCIHVFKKLCNTIWRV